ncbi:hypothetical protein N7507_003162 [Penicillium longicatenatum]|nr:hypothetical protein N7507_003162 [Penicillium longicatenatum]
MGTRATIFVDPAIFERKCVGHVLCIIGQEGTQICGIAELEIPGVKVGLCHHECCTHGAVAGSCREVRDRAVHGSVFDIVHGGIAEEKIADATELLRDDPRVITLDELEGSSRGRVCESSKSDVERVADCFIRRCGVLGAGGVGKIMLGEVLAGAIR